MPAKVQKWCRSCQRLWIEHLLYVTDEFGVLLMVDHDTCVRELAGDGPSRLRQMVELAGDIQARSWGAAFERDYGWSPYSDTLRTGGTDHPVVRRSGSRPERCVGCSAGSAHPHLGCPRRGFVHSAMGMAACDACSWSSPSTGAARLVREIEFGRLARRHQQLTARRRTRIA